MFLIASCTASPDAEVETETETEIEIEAETNDHPQMQGSLEYHDILVVPPVFALEAAVETGELEELETVVQAAQEYFDNTKLNFSLPTLYFVPLGGIYVHDNQNLLITGAFVNRYEMPIVAVSATVDIQVNIEGVQMDPIEISLGPGFMGMLQPNEALLITLEAPALGLEEDEMFDSFQFASELTNIRIIEYNTTQ